jgi:hypothetical protein
MAQRERIERPAQTIKTIVAPITSNTKLKISTAIQVVVDKIKEKHLG